ncbi:MarR family winged helix-turn-helix transcriptional regulator [Microbispora sp. NPDC049125]|uniref:MarR family winged helix-turn-helix transcriptional regulator n=1 Tax=Microbispora sp. NPDC049125 TaxID=3154929 RepID=UPI0034653879
MNDCRAEGRPEGHTDEREQLIQRLTELQKNLGRLFARDRSMPLLASTLTMQQLKVVMYLSFAGSTSGQDLARHLGVGLGTATGIVDRVVARGLVARREDPHDRRVRRVELTDAGRRLVTEMLDAGQSSYIRILNRLDTTTLRDLESAMDRVFQAIHDIDDDVPEGSPPTA